ncbi:MAG: aspartyl-tRNA(Asn)/glutamyl-tRNA(Gln) amidotransferase subunit, partial [Patescibacteria group bacterium]|nr:aspartyl-tRNA(Asn)/glutamyl-tRNA(Gln) amidotransferase subunit [Patescibacteria group bacterium]
MIDIKNLTIKKAHEHLKSGDFSVRELVDAYLSEIKSKDKEIHAYIEL